MIRRLLLSVAVLGLAACDPPEAVPPASAPAPAEPAPATPAAADVLTAQGFGPLRVGMTRAEIEAALGADSDPQAVGGPDPEACDMFHPVRAPEGLMVMLENGRLTSVWLQRGATVKTDRGFGVGDQASAIKAAYGSAAEAMPHKYEDAPAEYVTAWATADHGGPSARGIKYEIGRDGRVQAVAGGGASIQYVEGCA